MQILDGKKLQKIFLNDIKNTVSLLGLKPKLCIIYIEKSQAKDIYLNQIKKMCENVGFLYEITFYEAITEKSLLHLITKKNQDLEITSILILAPIPFYLNEANIYKHILFKKDVEALNYDHQLKRLQQNTFYYPCTASSIISLFQFHNIDIKEKNVVIINRSSRIGKPLFTYFLNQDCTITMMHSKSKNQEPIIKNADIIITAVGKGPIIDSELLKENSIIVDLGMFSENGKIIGDIKITNQEKKFTYLSHTGGVGPMTIACLAQNILKCYYLSQKDK